MLGTNECSWSVQRLKEMSFEHNPHNYIYSTKNLEKGSYNIMEEKQIFLWRVSRKHFLLKTCIWKKHIFWCMLKNENMIWKKKKRKDFWKHILYILFWSFGSPKRKREKELFSENKVSDTPLFFRKHFFFFFCLKRFWKKFSYDFWKQILKTAFRKQYLKNRFYFMQKTIFLLTQKTVFLYSAENSFYTVQKREKTDLNDSVIKQIFLLEN